MSGFRLVDPSAGRVGLVACVLAAMATAAGVSLILIFVLPGGTGGIDAMLQLNGPLSELIATIVPFVWIGLFGALGAAYWLVSQPPHGPGAEAAAILLLLALCIFYPILSSGFDFVPFAILGNAIVICCALVCAMLCWPVSPLAARFVGLIAIWVGLATISLVALYFDLPF